MQWAAVDTAWVNFNGWTSGVLAAVSRGSPDEQQRRAALEGYYGRGDTAGVRELWHRQTDPPRDPSELALAADVEADAGADAALPLISHLRAYQPAEADVILAGFFLKRQQYDMAASALERAFNRLRDDPWPLLAFKDKALRLAGVLGSQQPALARRLIAALRQPFALNAVSDERLATVIDLARVDFPALCRAPISELEPHVIWSEPVLRARGECYAVTHDSRQRIAARDLDDFLAHESQPLIIH